MSVAQPRADAVEIFDHPVRFRGDTAMIDSRTDKAGWTGKIFRQVLVVDDCPNAVESMAKVAEAPRL